jgi:hypothetical protein
MTYVRRTSANAYHEVMASGLLGERQKHAYEILYKHGPLTGNELSEQMGIPGQWKRCSELKKRGLAIEVGERECRVTGRVCIIWDVTDNPPRKVDDETRESSRQKIARLEAQIELLKRQLEWPVGIISTQIATGKKVSDEGIKWFNSSLELLRSTEAMR